MHSGPIAQLPVHGGCPGVPRAGDRLADLAVAGDNLPGDLYVGHRIAEPVDDPDQRRWSNILTPAARLAHRARRAQRIRLSRLGPGNELLDLRLTLFFEQTSLD